MWAAFKGNLDIAELLLNKRSDVNAKTRLGWTVLIGAVAVGGCDQLQFTGRSVNAHGSYWPSGRGVLAMRANVFRGAKWKQARRVVRTVVGVFLIVSISRVAAEEMMQVWPSWDQIICGVLVVNALFLSWAWFTRVHKAIEDGEFD